MDFRSLPPDFLEAGRDYLTALNKLGLEPEALFWAFDTTVSGFVLVLATSTFDAVGPLRISELLFQAYNLAATPREIDPFIVRLHSPKQQIIRTMVQAHALNINVKVIGTTADGRTVEMPAQNHQTHFADLEYAADWIYVLKPDEPSDAVAQRRYERFRDRVTRLAA